MVKKENNDKSIMDAQRNKDFVQFYRPALDSISDLAEKNIGAFKTFNFLIKYMDAVNAVYLTTKSIAELHGVSERTVQRNIKYLYDNGYIDKRRYHSTNLYIVNPRIAWRNKATKKENCKFTNDLRFEEKERNEFLKAKEFNIYLKCFDEVKIGEIMKGDEKSCANI